MDKGFCSCRALHPRVIDRIASRQKQLGDRDKSVSFADQRFQNLFQRIRGVFCIVMTEDDAARGRLGGDPLQNTGGS